jgi:hypothetical protein
MVSDGAVGRGDLGILRWIRQHGCNIDTYVICKAAGMANFEVAAWIIQLPETVRNQAAVHSAAIHGHTGMCKYLRSKQYPWDEDACYDAARFGHVDTLRWLQDNGCPWACS